MRMPLIKYGNIALTVITTHQEHFMSVMSSTSGRLHSEFIRLLFLQTHRETDRFFPPSGVQLSESTSGLFHFRRTAFSAQVKAKVGITLTKSVPLRVNLNIDDPPDPITSRTHTQRHHNFRKLQKF